MDETGRRRLTLPFWDGRLVSVTRGSGGQMSLVMLAMAVDIGKSDSSSYFDEGL